MGRLGRGATKGARLGCVKRQGRLVARTRGQVREHDGLSERQEEEGEGASCRPPLPPASCPLTTSCPLLLAAHLPLAA